MKEHCEINIRCPLCNGRLIKYRYASKGNWVTNWRIKCENPSCEVDTGEQCTLSDVYEALMFLYFGAMSGKHYTRNVEGDKNECNEM